MSKLDDVLEGTYEEPEHDHHDDVTGYPASDEDTTYETPAEVEEALAAGEIDEEEAIALLDELEEHDAPQGITGPATVAAAKRLAERDAGIAGPRDRVRIVDTGEEAIVAHSIGNGGIALAGEDRPRRTFPAGAYELI